MYSEQNTFDDILNRSLQRVRNDIDKREGSIIYDATSPMAAELAQAYIDIDTLIDLVFIDTSVGEYLDKLTEQMGIKRNVATKAIRKGTFYNDEQEKMDIEIGTIFSIDNINYTVIEKIDIGYLLGSWNILSFKHTKNMNIFLIVSNMCERRPLGHFGKRLLGHSGLSSPSPQCCRQNQRCIQAR